MTGSDKDKPRPEGRWLVDPQVFEPGDFFLAHSDGPMGGPIRWAETSPWEEPTEVNHTGVITRGGSIEVAEVVEALFRVVRRPFSELTDDLEVWRYSGRSNQAAADRALAHVGEFYGVGKLGLQAADHALGWLNYKVLGRKKVPVLFRRLGFIDSLPICSRITNEALGFSKYWNPDDIHDYVKSWPLCVKVYERKSEAE